MKMKRKIVPGYAENNIQRIIKNSLIRFLIVGGISTCCECLIYIMLSRQFNVYIAKTISMTICCTAVFFLNKRWTFQDLELADKTQVTKYVISQIVNVAVNVGVNGGLYQISKKKMFSYLVAITCSTIVNYLLQKIWVFKKRR